MPHSSLKLENNVAENNRFLKKKVSKKQMAISNKYK